jgi:hypothetical protein
MSRAMLLAVLLLALSTAGRGQADPVSAAATYLQMASDRFQSTVDVYSVSDSAGNHFAYRGEFDSLDADVVPAMDEISLDGPCLDITCITATFDPRFASWGGWYFMNGILRATDREPVANWGTVANAGYDLTGATKLRFWARGDQGGEVIHFFAFGVGNTVVPHELYPDSATKAETSPPAIPLSSNWAEYSIDLTRTNLNYVLGGFGWLAVGSEQAALGTPVKFYLARIQYVKPRPADPRLLVSYETWKSVDPGHDFDSVLRNVAFVYDNSVALIALLAYGDVDRARTIADAILYGQQHDRYFTGALFDGRIRNGYQGGDISLPPGWLPNNVPDTVRMPGWYDAGHQTWYEDATQVSTNTGNVAWAALGLLNMWEVTKESKYLAAAQLLGAWVLNNTADDSRGAGGFTGGYDGWEGGAASGGASTCASDVVVNGQCMRLYKSTEHNIDLVAVFSRLYLADGNSRWAQGAQAAKHFVFSMWDLGGGKFWTGTAEDGSTINKEVIPLDIQAWAQQALGSEAQPYLPALDYVESHHKTGLGYGFKQDGGNSCGDNTWFEGTSQIALSYLLSGNSAKWESVLDVAKAAQLPSGALPATDGFCLNTGFTLNDGLPWLYYPRAHVGATAWRTLAELGKNPYRAELYSPSISSSNLTFTSAALGQPSSAQLITFSNPGPSNLAINGISIGGANGSDFAQTNTCGSGLPPGGQCTLSITFKPSGAGMRRAVVNLIEASDPMMPPVIFSTWLLGSLPAATGGATVAVSPSSVPVGQLSTVTVNWSAPSSSQVEIHVGSAVGTLFAEGGSSGSAVTGAWASPETMFYLVDANTRQTLASVALLSAQSGATLTSIPSSVPAGQLSTVTVNWSAPSSGQVEIHVGSAAGALFAEGGPSGSAVTGAWASPETMFYLVDANTRQTLASVALLSAQSGATLTSIPSSVPAGQLSTVTVNWSAPSSGQVEIHVGSAAGALFAEGGPSGSAVTGAWASPETTFYLVDSITHQTLALVALNQAAPDM